MTKQITVDSSDEQPEENKQLVDKVDQMLNPELADIDTVSKDSQPEITKTDDDTPPPLDIFADMPSAPLLTPVKKTAVTKKSKKTKDLTEAPVETSTTDNPTEKPTANIQEDVAAASVAPTPKTPNEYDDSQTSAAIDSIVASEEDALLTLEDQVRSSQSLARPPKTSRHILRKLFWIIIAAVCVIALAVAMYVVYPSVKNPLGKTVWHMINHRVI